MIEQTFRPNAAAAATVGDVVFADGGAPSPSPNAPPAPARSPDALFHAYKFRGSNDAVAAYFVESTAPANVDVADPPDNDPTSQRVLGFTDPLPDDTATAEIAAQLGRMSNPEMVFLIHGFNNPRPVVLRRLEQAFEAVVGDPALGGAATAARRANHDNDSDNGHGLVCVGYRWPSERIGATLGSTLSAAPGIVGVLLWALALVGLIGLAGRFGVGGVLAAVWIEWAALAFAAGWLLRQNARSPVGRALLALVAAFGALGLLAERGLPLAVAAFRWPLATFWFSLFLLAFGLAFAAFALRILVYFRDAYRAVNYGVPDLVNVIRQIDAALGERPDNARVRLSFVGHSMGAFVTTNLVRVLSDAFARDATAGNSQRADEANKAISSHVGRGFRLGRLVLVSPDIPAETLMTRRSNFLRSSLRRFEEAYLFSSEGDEVLRFVSTLANYFSFPNKSRDFGFRLGNAEVVASEYGIVNLHRLRQPRPLEQVVEFLSRLRVGPNTLLSLGEIVGAPGRTTRENRENAERAEKGLPSEPPVANVDELPFAAQFTYFDCTDYIDVNPARGGRAAREPVGILTQAKKKAQLSGGNHGGLLLQYFFAASARKIDVHSGYFDAPFSRRLIYRLCCLGWERTLAASAAQEGAAREAALDAFSRDCAAHQIQVLLSPARYVNEPHKSQG